jgi:hypothetical protein
VPAWARCGHESEHDLNERPVRLRVSDDLERTRLTVLVRWLLAIQHFFWLALWTIVAAAAAMASWFATLARGRTPGGLHGFLATYVKYVTQLYGYLNLAANPYPPFDGRDGYPIDVEIAPPATQSRWRVAARIFLLIPALLFATALAGSPLQRVSTTIGRSTRSYGFSSPGLLTLVAVLGWFAVLARGRTPRGLRDAAAYCLSYGAQTWAYALLLTDRYPNSDPQIALPDLPLRSDPARLRLDDDLRRSRLTVFFRLLLTIPHLVWLALWSVVALVAAVLNWLAVLVTGRVPRVLARFLSAYLRYTLHVYGFLYLVANPFPGFTGRAGSYPMEPIVEVAARQKRLTVLFRLVLAVPALLLVSAYNGITSLAAVLGWFASLVTGRMPSGLRNAAALGLRYHLQTGAYLLVLNEAYPYTGPCRSEDQSAPLPASTDGPSAFG